MSHLVSRILLSIFLFPLAGIFYVFMVVVGEGMLRYSGSYRDREVVMFTLCSGTTWAGVALYWCLLWRSSVRWNGRRISLTLLTALGALLVGSVVGVVAAALMPFGGGNGFGVFVGGILTIMIWLIATVFVWRETATERAQRLTTRTSSAIVCPTCGYNLTGLTETRCPECGSRFTLNELIALQPKAEVEVGTEG